MSRRWSWFAALLLICFFSPSPARAQSWGDWGDGFERLESVGRAFEYTYIAGGTAVFASADIVFVGSGKRIPVSWGALQMVYGTSLALAGAMAARDPGNARYAALIPLGTAFIAVPIIDWSIRGKEKGHRAKIDVVGTRVVVSGTF